MVNTFNVAYHYEWREKLKEFISANPKSSYHPVEMLLKQIFEICINPNVTDKYDTSDIQSVSSRYGSFSRSIQWSYFMHTHYKPLLCYTGHVADDGKTVPTGYETNMRSCQMIITNVIWTKKNLKKFNNNATNELPSPIEVDSIMNLADELIHNMTLIRPFNDDDFDGDVYLL